MPARSGQQYIESLRRLQPVVYLNGRRVADVTTEPVFQGPIQAVAEQYDLQLMPQYREIMTYPSPTTGDPVSASFMVPRSREQVVQQRQSFKLRSDHNFGFMGRAPDFMNARQAGQYVNADHYGQADPRYADNIRNYYEYIREHDLFLTHTLISPQTDRSKTSSQQEDPFTHLGVVRETEEGVIVRGAKMLATMAPTTEEILVEPFGGVAPGDDRYAVTFAIPNNTPGLSYICRETYAPGPRSRFDHPLSSRFEEMDCVAVFDDVLIPWERVFVDGRPGSAAIINSNARALGGGTNQQVASRMLSMMEFMCGLATRLADAIGITGFLHIQEKLGEMLSYLEIGRGVYYGSEALAYEAPNGVWTNGTLGGRAFHLQTGKIYTRFVEIVHSLAGGGYFYAPSEADLGNPEIRPAIDTFVRGRPGVDAEERIALFKLAWDVCGDSFGSRVQQYVRFYSGDPVRNTAGFYVGYDKAPLWAIVDRALGRTPDLDIPISPEHAGIPTGQRPPASALTGTYPASSHPSPASAAQTAAAR